MKALRYIAALFAALSANTMVQEASAQSFEMSPILAELQPSGSRAEQTFRLVNRSSTPIAVDAAIRDRTMDDKGRNLDGEISEDFILVPPQMVVPAQGTQTLRLRWIGEPSVDRERPFRMRVRQIPVDFGEAVEGGRMTMAFSYVANIYVAPPNAQSQLALSSAQPIEREGQKFLEISLVNSGNKRAVLDRASLQVVGGGSQVALEGATPATEPLSTQTILAGETRSFLLPWPDALPFGAVTATFEPRYLIR